MTLLITHKKTATLPDQAGVEVNKAEWNDTHSLAGTLDASNFPTTGVVASSYTNTNLTVDGTGRITAASNGASSSIATTTNLIKGDGAGNGVDSGVGITSGGGTAVGTLSYTPSNDLGHASGTINSYEQIIIQNKSSSAAASSDFVVNNNQSTDTIFYGDYGMNSSGFTGTGAFNAPNNVYLTSTSSDLAIGTTTANAIHFVVNGGATDAATISSAGLLTLGTPLPVGSGGTGASSYTSGSVLFSDGTNIVQDNANLFWDDVNHALCLGEPSAPTGLKLDIAVSTGAVQGRGGMSPFSFNITRLQASAAGPAAQFIKGRGTLATPAAVIQNDQAGALSFGAYGDSTNVKVAGTVSTIIVEPTPSATAMGGAILFSPTILGATTQQEAIRAIAPSSGVVKIGINQNTPTASLDVPASIAAQSSMRIRSGVAPTSPNSGDIWNDSTQVALSNNIGGNTLYNRAAIYISTASKTIANTTTETSVVGTGIGTQTIAANTLTAGKTVTFLGGGVFSTGIGPGNLTIKVKFGSTAIASGVITNLPNTASSLAFQINAMITVRSIGASGTVIVNGNMSYETALLSRGFLALNNAGATTTIDTTASQVFDVTATWATAATTSILTTTTSSIELAA